ncbi:MAG: hypothetical protein AABW85_03855 [archaeon]
MVFGFGEDKADLVLEKTSFSAGEIIRGRLVLNISKPKKGRSVRVVLFGQKTQTEWRYDFSSKHSKPHTAVTKIYEFEIELDKEKEYSGNYAYDFEIAVPQSADARKQFESKIENTLQQYDNTPVGGIFRAAAGIGKAAMHPPRTDWFLEGKLDVPGGFDVSKKVQIQILQT